MYHENFYIAHQKKKTKQTHTKKPNGCSERESNGENFKWTFLCLPQWYLHSKRFTVKFRYLQTSHPLSKPEMLQSLAKKSFSGVFIVKFAYQFSTIMTFHDLKNLGIFSSQDNFWLDFWISFWKNFEIPSVPDFYANLACGKLNL